MKISGSKKEFVLLKNPMELSPVHPKLCAQAPQFVDFNNLGGGAAPEEEDRADEFFNVDMESGERYK